MSFGSTEADVELVDEVDVAGVLRVLVGQLVGLLVHVGRLCVVRGLGLGRSGPALIAVSALGVLVSGVVQLLLESALLEAVLSLALGVRAVLVRLVHVRLVLVYLRPRLARRGVLQVVQVAEQGVAVGVLGLVVLLALRLGLGLQRGGGVVLVLAQVELVLLVRVVRVVVGLVQQADEAVVRHSLTYVLTDVLHAVGQLAARVLGQQRRLGDVAVVLLRGRLLGGLGERVRLDVGAVAWFGLGGLNLVQQVQVQELRYGLRPMTHNSKGADVPPPETTTANPQGVGAVASAH